MAISEGALAHCVGVPFRFISKDDDLHNLTCTFGTEKINIQDLSFYKKFGLTQDLFGIPALRLPVYIYFRMTYYTTLVSCAFGITHFLEVGPTRILPKDEFGFRKSLAAYMLAVIIVVYSLYTKALGIGSDGSTMHIILDVFNYNCAHSDMGK